MGTSFKKWGEKIGIRSREAIFESMKIRDPRLSQKFQKLFLLQKPDPLEFLCYIILRYACLNCVQIRIFPRASHMCQLSTLPDPNTL